PAWALRAECTRPARGRGPSVWPARRWRYPPHDLPFPPLPRHARDPGDVAVVVGGVHAAVAAADLDDRQGRGHGGCRGVDPGSDRRPRRAPRGAGPVRAEAALAAPGADPPVADRAGHVEG